MERSVVVVVLSLLLCSEQVLSFNAHGIIDPYENLLRGEEAYYDLGKRITMDGDQKVGIQPVKGDEATGTPYGLYGLRNAKRGGGFRSLAGNGIDWANMDTANAKLTKRPFSSLGPSGRLGERRRRAEYFLNHLARMNK